jgi:hypothetical protein
MTSRFARAGITALIAAAMWAGAAGGAHAAPLPDDSDVTVTVPPATPSPTSFPSIPPGVPPAANGGSNAGGGNADGSGGGANRSSSGGATGGGAADTAAPTDAACVPKEPAVPSAPTTGAGEASVDKEVYSAGDTVTAIAAGFGAGEQVQLVLFSEPALVGTFAADTTGAVTAQFAIAGETLAGMHTVQFTGWCGSASTADLLVGATNSASTAGPQGVPPWLWWICGILAAILLIVGAWWALRVMRAPAAVEAVPA